MLLKFKGGILKKILILLFTTTLFSLSFSEINPAIDSLLSEISGDSIWNNIDTLTTLERYTTSTNAVESVDFLEDFLNNFNYDLVTTQRYASGYTPNVYAVKEGEVTPDEYLLICAHYDSYKVGAEAADDNGSGTAGLMEIARVLNDYKFDKSIILAFFSGEELGLFGSEFFSDSAYNNDLDIVTVINLDVIGYIAPGSPFDFDCSYNNASIGLYNDFKSLVNEYIPEVSIVDASSKTFWQSSDHKSFWDNGYNALFLAGELDRYSSHFNSMWHSSNDKLGSSVNSKKLLETVSRAATLVTVNEAIIYEEPVSVTENMNIKGLNREIYVMSAGGNSLKLNSLRSSNISLKIFNVSGQAIDEISNQFVNKGISRIELTKSLGRGFYIAEIAGDGVSLKQPFIIK